MGRGGMDSDDSRKSGGPAGGVSCPRTDTALDITRAERKTKTAGRMEAGRDGTGKSDYTAGNKARKTSEPTNDQKITAPEKIPIHRKGRNILMPTSASRDEAIASTSSSEDDGSWLDPGFMLGKFITPAEIAICIIRGKTAALVKLQRWWRKGKATINLHRDLPHQ